MQEIVKVNINDFDLDIFEKIKLFAQNGEFGEVGEVVINFRPKNKKSITKMTKDTFVEKIESSMKQVEAGEFVTYPIQKFQN